MIQTLPNWGKLRLEFTFSHWKKTRRWDDANYKSDIKTKILVKKLHEFGPMISWSTEYWFIICIINFFIFLQDYKYLTDEGVFIHELKYYLPGEHCVDIIMKDAAEDDYEYDYENSYVFDDGKINQTNSDYSLVVLFRLAEGKDIEDCLKTSTVRSDSDEAPE